MSSLNDWISLDVGGTLFKTRRSTLVSVPGSLLANMFDPESDMLPARQENGAYIIDVSPQEFGVILNWLRFKKLMVPKNMELKDVQVVTEYFGIQEMEEEVKKEARAKAKLPDGWICLEVGGTLFKT